MNKTSQHINSSYEIFQPLLISAVLAIGMIVGFRMNDNSTDFELLEKVESENEIGIGRVEEIIRFIDTKYVDDIEDNELIEDAITRIFSKLDPHSLYIPPEQVRNMNEQIQGSYDGFGLETLFFNDSLIVSKVLNNSPSLKADINLFDIIVSINGEPVSGAGKDYNRIKQLMRSEKGDSMMLSILDGNSNTHQDRILISSEIRVKSADISFMINDSVGYIKIERFNSQVYKEFMESLEKLAEIDEFKHLIIDVRQNPGGYLPETLNIISQLFKEKDRLLFYTQGKSDDAVEYKSTGRPFFPFDNISILIDEGSASGSEILAGSIQDWDRGVIIGRRSFGKGLVQEQFKLRNGGIIRLTVARYFTPSGRSIQRPYEDRESYNGIFKNRKKNGELLNGDSIIYIDSTRYYTKNLERVIFGQGGISPDLFIPMDSTQLDDNFLLLKNYLISFSYTYIQLPDIQLPFTYEAFNDLEIDQSFTIEQLKIYCKKHELPVSEKWLAENSTFLFSQIKESLVNLLYGDKAYYQYKSQNDPFIAESLRAFQINNLLALSQ